MSDANAIVQCARSWIGTRFHHQGRIKKTTTHKGGVDCLGLLIGVASELNLQSNAGTLLAHEDERDYAHYPDSGRLIKRLSGLLTAIQPSQLVPGDILVLTIDNRPQHLAIAAQQDEKTTMIHAYAPARAVVEHRMDSYWFERIAAVFRV